MRALFAVLLAVPASAVVKSAPVVRVAAARSAALPLSPARVSGTATKWSSPLAPTLAPALSAPTLSPAATSSRRPKPGSLEDLVNRDPVDPTERFHERNPDAETRSMPLTEFREIVDSAPNYAEADRRVRARAEKALRQAKSASRSGALAGLKALEAQEAAEEAAVEQPLTDDEWVDSVAALGRRIKTTPLKTGRLRGVPKPVVKALGSRFAKGAYADLYGRRAYFVTVPSSEAEETLLFDEDGVLRARRWTDEVAPAHMSGRLWRRTGEAYARSNADEERRKPAVARGSDMAKTFPGWHAAGRAGKLGELFQSLYDSSETPLSREQWREKVVDTYHQEISKISARKKQADMKRAPASVRELKRKGATVYKMTVNGRDVYRAYNDDARGNWQALLFDDEGELFARGRHGTGPHARFYWEWLKSNERTTKLGRLRFPTRK